MVRNRKGFWLSILAPPLRFVVLDSQQASIASLVTWGFQQRLRGSVVNIRGTVWRVAAAGLASV